MGNEEIDTALTTFYSSIHVSRVWRLALGSRFTTGCAAHQGRFETIRIWSSQRLLCAHSLGVDWTVRHELIEWGCCKVL